MDMAQDSEGNILLASKGAGLIVFNVNKGKSISYLHDSDDPESILTNENSSILIDRTNIIFLGSYGRGVSKYSPYSSKFRVFSIPESDSTSGETNAFTDAIEDGKGNLITGTYNGFLVFDKETWAYRHYLPGTSYEDNKILTLKL